MESEDAADGADQGEAKKKRENGPLENACSSTVSNVTSGASLCDFPGDASDDDTEWCNVLTGGSLIPPINFGIVEEDVYRSGMPNELSFPFLEKLQLKTIVYLATEEVPEPLESFVDDQGINLVMLSPDEEDVSGQWPPMSEDVVLRAMQQLLDPATHPIHIMCSGGRHKTGTVIGCLRKMQKWYLASIFEEYRRYATTKGRLANEQFIELFDTDLVNIPTCRPSWLP